MKAFKRRVLQWLIVCTALALVLAGCTGGDAGQTNESGEPAASDGGNQTSEQPAAETPKERVTLKVEVFDRGNSPEGFTVTKNLMTEYVQKNFGDPNNIDVEFVAVPRSEEINQLNVLMAAGTAPDLIFTYNSGAMYNWAKQGGLTDLTKVLDEHGPDLKAYLGDALNYGVFDGVQYAVVARRVNLEKYTSVIRQDWLDAVGLPVPKTTEETYNALKKFKELKLGGDRTIPLSFALTPDSYEPVLWSFIKEQSDEARYLKSVTIGSREYPILADGHKDGMRFLNKLYNEGLIDPDFALDKDKKQKVENFVKGYTGLMMSDVTQYYFGGEESQVSVLEKNVPGASVTPLLPWTDFEGKTRQPSYTPSGMLMGVPSFSERSVEAIKYLNWMAQDEVIQYMAFGEEGVHHDIVDGFPVRNGSDEDAKLLYNTGDMLIITNGIDFGSPERNLEYNGLIIDEKHRADAIANRAMSSQDAVQQPIRFDKPLDSEAKHSVVMLEKYEELLVKSVMTKPDQFDAVYDAALKDFMDTAGNEVIAERKAAYEAMK
ncbi:extracellular solute-binding protein [Paenibacillus sp. TRM 82003]|nr:extracellular solute-binding protein [Paenibacillus sp. TRM 82003]